MSTAYFGEEINRAIKNARGNADRINEWANAVEDAWKEWDVPQLVELGALTRRDGQALERALVEERS